MSVTLHPERIYMPTIEANLLRQTLRSVGIECRLVMGRKLGHWRVEALPHLPRTREELFYDKDEV